MTQEKLDVIDLIIQTLMEYEKVLDQFIDRFEHQLRRMQMQLDAHEDNPEKTKRLYEWANKSRKVE